MLESPSTVGPARLALMVAVGSGAMGCTLRGGPKYGQREYPGCGLNG